MLPSRARADAFAFPPKNLRRMQIGHDRGRVQACPPWIKVQVLEHVLGFLSVPRPSLNTRFTFLQPPAALTPFRGRNVTMDQGTESNLG